MKNHGTKPNWREAWEGEGAAEKVSQRIERSTLGRITIVGFFKFSS